MIQAAQARLSGGWGFLSRRLLASRSWLRAARVAISLALNASRAGWAPGPSRACSSWMMITAAFAAMATSLTRRSAVATWLSSSRKPWVLSTRKESADQIRQVAPFEIVLFDKLNFPISIPFLELLLAADGVLSGFVSLHIHKPMDFV